MSNLQVGEKFTVEITGLTHEGMGVGRIGERVVFIPHSLPGDLIKIKVVEIKKRLAFGELLEILEPSTDRIKPSCPHAKTCGGCQFQHLQYTAQLEWKRQQVYDAMKRIGKLDVKVLPTLGMENPYHYRNNSQMPFGDESGELILGFFKPGSHEIIDVETCEIQHPLITKLALTLKRIVSELKIEPYDRAKHKGILRHAVIRVSFAKKELMLILVTNTHDLPHKEQLINQLTNEVPELVSVIHNVNSQKTNVVMGRKTEVLWGNSHLIDTIGHLSYAISPRSFFQVNPLQTEVLYDLVREEMHPNDKGIILDLYCGAGTIGLYLAADAKRIIGVESFADAVKDANYNAELNGIKNAKFVVGKAENELPKIMDNYDDVSAVVVDPPRKGCDAKLLETLNMAKVPQIVYVSCNPSTLARDLAVLVEGGYSIDSVQPIDMFPWTRHVETVVLLSQRKADNL